MRPNNTLARLFLAGAAALVPTVPTFEALLNSRHSTGWPAETAAYRRGRARSAAQQKRLSAKRRRVRREKQKRGMRG